MYIENNNSEIISMIIWVQNFWCEHFLDLWWICTDESYRWKGLSSGIINEIWNIWTNECQTKYPYLFISNYNEMIEFYEKKWFEKIFSHHSKAVIMVKKLFEKN